MADLSLSECFVGGDDVLVHFLNVRKRRQVRDYPSLVQGLLKKVTETSASPARYRLTRCRTSPILFLTMSRSAALRLVTAPIAIILAPFLRPIFTTSSRCPAGVLEASEPVLVQALAAQPPVKALLRIEVRTRTMECRDTGVEDRVAER
jgi:hypothetical protein